jgi:hypothetical protein
VSEGLGFRGWALGFGGCWVKDEKKSMSCIHRSARNESRGFEPPLQPASAPLLRILEISISRNCSCEPLQKGGFHLPSLRSLPPKRPRSTLTDFHRFLLGTLRLSEPDVIHSLMPYMGIAVHAKPASSCLRTQADVRHVPPGQVRALLQPIAKTLTLRGLQRLRR